MPVQTIEWRNGRVVMLDQRLLPTREVYRVYRDHREVARAIKDMVVRGAPAIGVAAAMGIALGVRSLRGDLPREFDRLCRTFASTRPTAVNLFWAIERMRRVFSRNEQRPHDTIRTLLEREALAIHDEDVAVNRAARALRRRADRGRRHGPHALQRGRARHRRLRHRARRGARRGRGGKAHPGHRVRDAALSCRVPVSPPGSSRRTASPSRSSPTTWPDTSCSAVR